MNSFVKLILFFININFISVQLSKSYNNVDDDLDQAFKNFQKKCAKIRKAAYSKKINEAEAIESLKYAKRELEHRIQRKKRAKKVLFHAL